MNAPIKIRDPHSQGRTYTYSFTFGGLASLVAALTLALTLFFVLGVLVGRGHRPEAALPPIARIMPTEPAANQATSEILKAEDLQFGDNLGKGADAGPAKSMDGKQTKQGNTAEKKSEQKPEQKPEQKSDKKDDQKAAEKLADKKAAADTAKDTTKDAGKDEAKKDDKDPKRYNYIYQIGSFPEQDQAKAFLKKVKGGGVSKATIETGTVGGKAWYRVVVPFQGTPIETRGLKAKLNSVGVSKIVMRSKKPL